MKVNINRQLAGLEDIAFGIGTVIQERQGELVEITKVNLSNLPFNETLSAAEVLMPIYEQVVPHIAEILEADTNASITTTKAAEASDSAAAALASEQAAAASAAAALASDQTIAGIKTFSSIPVLPASSPTTDNQATRKKYVDDGLALKTGIGTATPLAPAVTAVVGTSTLAARQDHVHPTNFTSTATDIKMNGTQAVGTLTTYPRADHVHPSDTSKANLVSPTFTGTPAAPTAGVDTNTTQLATTAFVLGQAASSAPVMNGTATVGTSTRFARQDHVHPSDTSKVDKVTSTDNAIVRFNGTTGQVQNSSVTIDDSGNVGIGVIPSASGSSTKGIQTTYNYMGSQGGSGQIMYNAVPASDTTSKYLYSSLPVVAYEQNPSGQHLWKTAPSGTADNPITWNTAMTLGSNGNLLVGTTADNGVDKLQVNGSISLNSHLNLRGQKTYTKFASISGGPYILESIFGDVQTMGELYVVEIGTDKYLRATFYKRGTSYAPVCTVLASNGLSLGINNSLGTQTVIGATNDNNIRMTSEIKTVY